MVDVLIQRTWVKNRTETDWHWFCEGLDHDPRGPARCGAQPDNYRWMGKKKGQWYDRLNSKRPRDICKTCISLARLYFKGESEVMRCLSKQITMKLPLRQKGATTVSLCITTTDGKS